MIIKEDLPFTQCNNCPELILHVEEQVIFADDGILTRQLTVRCRNDELCKRLDRIRKEQADEESMHEDLPEAEF